MMDLVLISSKHSYVERFDRYIRTSEWREHIRIHRHETVESYRQSELASRARHVILFDDTAGEGNELDRLLGEEEASPSIDRVIRLTEDPSEQLADSTIFMYQPVSQIVSQVRTLLAKQDRPAEQQHVHQARLARPEGQEATVIGVVSPYGGAGVTTVSYHLARLMAVRQSRVLYVPLGLYPEPVVTPGDVRYDLSRLLYMMSTRPQEVERDWQHYCGIHQPSGVHSLRLPVHRRDLRDVTSDHINDLCRLFGRVGFATIVLDLDAHWLDDMIEGKLMNDECWLISPWKKRQLTNLPVVRDFIRKREVKYIINGATASDGMAAEAGDVEIDAILPWVTSQTLQEDSIMVDERIDTIFMRLIRESRALEGAGGVG